ncbi:type II toxin-antitoxin system RelE/ParE family toxin [Mesorhizobium qingshengii]|uniref:type II toxin-antitoxin system RelE/ParE family toxin n=1 Tax=Mesorhizobium qingshengii TaxID=1165689 RepID=UPI000B8098EE
MAEYRLSAPAEAQIDKILDWSQEKFGDLSRERYAALLVAAMEDVADDPEQKSVSWRRTTFGSIGAYHIGHSRRRVASTPKYGPPCRQSRTDLCSVGNANAAIASLATRAHPARDRRWPFPTPPNRLARSGALRGPQEAFVRPCRKRSTARLTPEGLL